MNKNTPRRRGRRTIPFVLPKAFPLVFSALSLTAPPALASDFAEPPFHRRASVVATETPEPPPLPSSTRWEEPKLSFLRFYAGPAGKFDANLASPGLLIAVDIGRGPAGARLTSAWLDVGSANGISQYTGELTLDFGKQSRFRPTIGAGGGIARTSSSKRADGSMNQTEGALVGIGIVRAGIAWLLPLEDTDARLGFDLTGALPAIRGQSAPELTPWALVSLNVGIGF